MSLNAAVAATILALSASYAVLAPGQGPELAHMSADKRAAALASGMARYRGAVIAYYGTHPGEYGSASPAALQAAGVLPSWLAANGLTWQHYRAGDGTIYVYAPALPPVNLTAALLSESDNSVMVGTYRSGQSLYVSAFAGPTAIAAPPAALGIPDASPLWLAQPN